MFVGTVLDGLVIESISFDPPEVYLTCGNGHRIWSTPKMIECGMKLICQECKSEADMRAKSAQIMRDALKDIEAGNLF
jgi:hypothetical protein